MWWGAWGLGEGFRVLFAYWPRLLMFSTSLATMHFQFVLAVNCLFHVGPNHLKILSSNYHGGLPSGHFWPVGYHLTIAQVHLFSSHTHTYLYKSIKSILLYLDEKLFILHDKFKISMVTFTFVNIDCGDQRLYNETFSSLLSTRLTDSPSYLSLSLSLYIYIYIYMCVCVCVCVCAFSVYVCICVFVCAYVCMCLSFCVFFVYVSVCLPFSLSLSVSFPVHVYICPYVRMSIFFSVCVCMCLPFSLCVYVSVFLCMCVCVCMCLPFSLCVCMCLSVFLCVCVYACMCLPFSLCVYVYVFLNVFFMYVSVLFSVSVCLSVCLSVSEKYISGYNFLSKTPTNVCIPSLI